MNTIFLNILILFMIFDPISTQKGSSEAYLCLWSLQTPLASLIFNKTFPKFTTVKSPIDCPASHQPPLVLPQTLSFTLIRAADTHNTHHPTSYRTSSPRPCRINCTSVSHSVPSTTRSTHCCVAPIDYDILNFLTATTASRYKIGRIDPWSVG